jgi:hypothetical protein
MPISRSREAQGEYFSINTPVELYSFGARYVDLEIDDLPAWRKIRDLDREELALLVKNGAISAFLRRKPSKRREDLVKNRLREKGVEIVLPSNQPLTS